MGWCKQYQFTDTEQEMLADDPAYQLWLDKFDSDAHQDQLIESEQQVPVRVEKQNG